MRTTPPSGNPSHRSNPGAGQRPADTSPGSSNISSSVTPKSPRPDTASGRAGAINRTKSLNAPLAGLATMQTNRAGASLSSPTHFNAAPQTTDTGWEPAHSPPDMEQMAEEIGDYLQRERLTDEEQLHLDGLLQRQEVELDLFDELARDIAALDDPQRATTSGTWSRPSWATENASTKRAAGEDSDDSEADNPFQSSLKRPRAEAESAADSATDTAAADPNRSVGYGALSKRARVAHKRDTMHEFISDTLDPQLRANHAGTIDRVRFLSKIRAHSLFPNLGIEVGGYSNWSDTHLGSALKTTELPPLNPREQAWLDLMNSAYGTAGRQDLIQELNASANNFGQYATSLATQGRHDTRLNHDVLGTVQALRKKYLDTVVADVLECGYTSFRRRAGKRAELAAELPLATVDEARADFMAFHGGADPQAALAKFRADFRVQPGPSSIVVQSAAAARRDALLLMHPAPELQLTLLALCNIRSTRLVDGVTDPEMSKFLRRSDRPVNHIIVKLLGLRQERPQTPPHLQAQVNALSDEARRAIRGGPGVTEAEREEWIRRMEALQHYICKK